MDLQGSPRTSILCQSDTAAPTSSSLVAVPGAAAGAEGVVLPVESGRSCSAGPVGSGVEFSSQFTDGKERMNYSLQKLDMQE